MTNAVNRNGFQELPGSENPQFLEDGKRIYLEIRKRYPEDSIEDLDNILNGLCAALIVMLEENVDKSNHKNMVQLIYQIISKNL